MKEQEPPASCGEGGSDLTFILAPAAEVPLISVFQRSNLWPMPQYVFFPNYDSHFQLRNDEIIMNRPF